MSQIAAIQNKQQTVDVASNSVPALDLPLKPTTVSQNSDAPKVIIIASSNSQLISGNIQAATSSKLASINSQPAASSGQPAFIKSQPASSNGQSPSSNSQPASIKSQPASSSQPALSNSQLVSSKYRWRIDSKELKLGKMIGQGKHTLTYFWLTER